MSATRSTGSTGSPELPACSFADSGYRPVAGQPVLVVAALEGQGSGPHAGIATGVMRSGRIAVLVSVRGRRFRLITDPRNVYFDTGGMLG